jgi:C_GCAxxG_C_C family probable redox protein
MTERERRVKDASDMFLSGFNCAQSTAAPFSDLVGMDSKTMIKASAAFGGGVSKLREVCGVVSGIMLVYGLSQDENTDLSSKKEKAKLYENGQVLVKEFSDLNDTINCGELLEVFDKNPMPADRTDEYYKERPCLKLVEDGAQILCDYFNIA